MATFDVDFGWEIKNNEAHEQLVGRAVNATLNDLPQNVRKRQTKEGRIHRRLEVSFLSPETMKKINFEFRKKNRPTDVLSFSQLDGADNPGSHGLLGEIYLCPKVAKENARKAKISLEEELVRLAVHGVLHLFGYDHEFPDDEKRMFRRQERLVKKLIPKKLTPELR